MRYMAYRYRLYPEAEQDSLLYRTVGCCRFVSNKAVHLFRANAATKTKQPSYADLCGMLTDWKNEHPFLREVPHHCLQQALKDARAALDKFFDGETGFPKPHHRGEKDSCRFPDAGQFTCGSLIISLPKLGDVAWLQHRPMTGTLKSVTVSLDGGHWYASVLVEIAEDLPVPGEVNTVRAADLGVAVPVVDSDGVHHALPQLTNREKERQRRLQKTIARRKKGSKNRRRAVAALNRFQAHLRRRRLDAIRKLVRVLFHGVDALALEDLNVKGMTASAKGTVDAPGVNVAQKAGLNRAILDVGWGIILREAKTYARQVGKRVLHPKHAYSSQECACCHHIAAENRPTQAKFRCVRCGHEANADDNAATVLHQRTMAHLAELVGKWDNETAKLAAQAEQARARREKVKSAMGRKRQEKKAAAEMAAPAGGLPAAGCGAFRGSPRDEAATSTTTEQPGRLAA
jgi:putative transposase